MAPALRLIEVAGCDSEGSYLLLSGSFGLRRFQEQTDTSSNQASDTGDHERSRPGPDITALRRILEVTCYLRSGDTSDTIRQEYPAIIGADIFVAEEISRCRREEGKVSTEVKANNTSANRQTNY